MPSRHAYTGVLRGRNKDFVALFASVSPTTLSATINGAGTATTSSATVTTGGNYGNLSYSWSATNGVSANSPSSATTTFSEALSSGQTVSSTATCTVADAFTSGGSKPVQPQLTITLTSNNVSLSASVSPGSVSSGGQPGGSLQTQGFSVSVSNGSGSYTYSWSVTNANGMDAFIAAGGSGVNIAIQWHQPSSYAGQFAYTDCNVLDTNTGQTALGRAYIFTN